MDNDCIRDIQEQINRINKLLGELECSNQCDNRFDSCNRCDRCDRYRQGCNDRCGNRLNNGCQDIICQSYCNLTRDLAILLKALQDLIMRIMPCSTEQRQCNNRRCGCGGFMNDMRQMDQYLRNRYNGRC